MASGGVISGGSAEFVTGSAFIQHQVADHAALQDDAPRRGVLVKINDSAVGYKIIRVKRKGARSV